MIRESSWEIIWDADGVTPVTLLEFDDLMDSEIRMPRQSLPSIGRPAIIKRFTGNSGGIQVRATLSGGATIGTQVKTATISFGSSTGAVVTKITGTGISNSDITCRGTKLVWDRSPSAL